MTASNGLKTTEKRTTLKQGALLNWLSLGLNFSVSFLVTPIIIHKLGSVGFGMWALIQSFSGYYGLVNLGLASALQRFVSRDLAKADLVSLQRTVGTAVSFFSISGLLVLAAAILLHAPAAAFFDVPSAEADRFSLTILLCAVSVVTDFFGALQTTMLTARERFDLSNYLNISRQIFQTAGILVVLYLFPTINGIAMVVCITSLLSSLAGRLIVGRLYSGITLGWRSGDMSRLKELLHYGTSTVLITVTNIVRLRLGNLVIAKTADLATVGVYSLASNLIVSMNTLMSSSLNVLNPRFTRLHSQNDQSELQRLYRVSLFFSSALACGMGMMMLLFGERFIIFWVGEKYISAAPILSVLAVAYAVSHAQAPGWNLMFALAKHHFMARVTSIEALVIVVLGFWLSKSHSALGFAWATAACMLFTKIFLQPSYAARIANLKLSEYLAPMSVPFAVASALVGTSYLIDFPEYLRHRNVLVFFGAVAACGALYCSLIFIFSRNRAYFPSSILRVLRRPANA